MALQTSSLDLSRKGQTAASLPSKVRPLPLWQALLYFGLPALLFRISIYQGAPLLLHLGLAPFEANIVSFTIPSAILFAFAIGLYQQDGYSLSWASVRARFRLLPMSGKAWLWTVLALLATFMSLGALSFTANMLVKAFPAVAPPAFFPPWQKPGTTFDLAVFTQFIGAPLRGNWGVALLLLIQLFFNIFGEELWWRGYILPRQEQTHGRWAWLIHGILWWLWHVVFYPWQVIALLPICLVVPFVAQRLQNTWPAILIHVQNGVILLLILAMVMGIS